jgi:NgoMIV restriction enzyme
VYHSALSELKETLEELAAADSKEMFDIMVSGKRLKDIADLRLDLAVLCSYFSSIGGRSPCLLETLSRLA